MTYQNIISLVAWVFLSFSSSSCMLLEDGTIKLLSGEVKRGEVPGPIRVLIVCDESSNGWPNSPGVNVNQSLIKQHLETLGDDFSVVEYDNASVAILNEISPILNISKFDVLLLGDHTGCYSNLTLPTDWTLIRNNMRTLFNAANNANIPILAIGNNDNGYPLMQDFAYSGGESFGIIDNYSDWDTNAMEIEISPGQSNHPIFENTQIDFGLNGLFIDDVACQTNWPELDEGSFDLDANWTVLATLGINMFDSGKSTIAERVTPEGTKIIIDSSATTYDWYECWTSNRWQMIVNELKYLAK